MNPVLGNIQGGVEAEAVAFLRRNRGNKLYTPAAPEWYTGGYLWDDCLVAIVHAKCGAPEDADLEIRSLLRAQKPNGFIPNLRIDTTIKARINPERRLTFSEPEYGSNYGQPLLMADAALETFRSYLREGEAEKAHEFITDVYPELFKAYDYYWTHRVDTGSVLPNIIDPCETGRDCDPTFDFIKLRLPRSGIETGRLTNTLNPALDYLGVMTMRVANRLDGWDLEKVKKRFWIKDLHFITVYAQNLRSLANIAGKLDFEDDTINLVALAEAVEREVAERMWFPEERKGDGAFYDLNKDGQPIKVVSVNNLFPLLLPNLTPQQLKNCLDMADRLFDTPYPFSTVPTDSKEYDPHYQEKGTMWRGSTWMPTNYLLIKALFMQSDRSDIPPELAERAAKWHRRATISTAALIRRSGVREMYDPETGEGQRIRDLSMSTLGYLALRELDQQTPPSQHLVL